METLTKKNIQIGSIIRFKVFPEFGDFEVLRKYADETYQTKSDEGLLHIVYPVELSEYYLIK